MTSSEQAAEIKINELLAALRNQQQKNLELEQCNARLTERNTELEQQVEWFKRQIFGEKSEKRLPLPPSEQLHLGEMLEDELPPPPEETVKAYQRRRRPKEALSGSPEDSGLRFDESVPVQVVPVPNPAIEGLKEDE